MDILFLLVPLSVFIAFGVMGVLAWAVWAGQFEELENEGQRILMVPDIEKDALTDTSLIYIKTPLVAQKHT